MATLPVELRALGRGGGGGGEGGTPMAAPDQGNEAGRPGVVGIERVTRRSGSARTANFPRGRAHTSRTADRPEMRVPVDGRSPRNGAECASECIRRAGGGLPVKRKASCGGGPFQISRRRRLGCKSSVMSKEGDHALGAQEHVDADSTRTSLPKKPLKKPMAGREPADATPGETSAPRPGYGARSA